MKKIENFIFTFYLMGMFSIFFSISISQLFFLLSLFLFIYWLIDRIIKKESITWSFTFILGALMYLWSGLSDIYNGDLKQVLYIERDIWLFFPVLMIPNIAREKKEIEKIFMWIAYAAIIFGILGIVEALTSVSLKTLFTTGKIVYLPQYFSGDPEIALFTGLSLTYAALYFFPIAFFLYRLAGLFQNSYKEYFAQFFSKTNLFYLGGFLISFFNILATGRRSALVGVLLVLPFIWWFKSRKKAPFVLGAIFLLAFFFLHTGFRQRVINPFYGGDLSTNYRILMYNASLQSSIEKPLLGVGTKNYAQILQEKKVVDVSGKILEYGHSHNDFLDRLATGGFPSMFLLIAIFAYMLWQLKKIYANATNKESKDYALMVIGILLVFAIASQFQCYLTDDENLIFFTAALGIGEFLLREIK